jgi:hypothetical protein
MRYHEMVASSAKTLQKMRQNPSGWRIEDLQAAADENDADETVREWASRSGQRRRASRDLVAQGM